MIQVKPLMDSLEGARKSKADADASLKVSNDLVAAVEAKLQQLQDKFMEVRALDTPLFDVSFSNCIPKPRQIFVANFDTQGHATSQIPFRPYRSIFLGVCVCMLVGKSSNRRFPEPTVFSVLTFSPCTGNRREG